MVNTITATQAARRFRELLDRVEHDRETFEVQRHGRPIARVAPATHNPRGVRWQEVRRALLEGPRPDPAFAADLAEIRRGVEPVPRDLRERS